MKKDIKNIEASVRALLQNKAKETNRPFQEVLQYYGMERFLYRFSRSEYADKFILKGALMFTVWQVPQRRTTLDIDFSSTYDNQIVTIEKVIRDVCKVSVAPDGLVFDSQTIKGQRNIAKLLCHSISHCLLKKSTMKNPIARRYGGPS